MTDLNKNWASQTTEAQQVKNSTALNKMEFGDSCKENLENNSERIKHWKKHSLYHLVEEREQLSQEKQRLLLGTMNSTVIDAPQFFTKTIASRKVILDPWFREGGLGYIFGRRGTGKTWLAWYMALSISAGRWFGKWQCPTPQKVLYVDGEMSMDAMQRRLILLDPCPSHNLYISSHQALAEEGGIFYNLANSYQQEDFLEYCVQNDLDVVFLDNLSCLFSGMKENEADSWEQVRTWLLKFRQSGIAVVIVHHSNRTGNDMRGTSRREDAADWIIQVSPNHRGKSINRGKVFTTKFTKSRDDNGQEEQPLDWAFVTEGDRTVVEWRQTAIEDLIYELVKNGVELCSDIAEELGISKALVSWHAKKLIDQCFIKKIGQKYVLSHDSVPQ